MRRNNIFNTALYSFKEIKNSKIFYSFLIFALILISGSYFVSQTSFISQGRIMVDFSIFAITIFNIFIGIFIGSSVVYDDIEKKSIFLSITRPVKRTQYLIGRFLGVVFAIIFSTVVMMLIFYIVLLIMHKYVIPIGGSHGFMRSTASNVAGSVGQTAVQPNSSIVSGYNFFSNIYTVPQPLLIQGVFIIIESVFISAVSLLFSLITSKALASIFSILVFFIGNVSSKMNDLVKPVKKILNGKIIIVHPSNHVLSGVVHFIYAVLPNFSIFNVSSDAAYKIFISQGTVYYRLVYGLSYSAILFIISAAIFARKDIS